MKLDFEKVIKDGVEQAMREYERTVGMTVEHVLEKQIPKKPASHTVQPVEAPIQIGHGNWGAGTTVYKCPNCKCWVSKIYKHCHDCGQALDWRDEE